MNINKQLFTGWIYAHFILLFNFVFRRVNKCDNVEEKIQLDLYQSTATHTQA